MADVKWIKIVVDIFDDEKILLIEELPEADSIIVIWFKLLCLAGKQNNYGVFMVNDSIPYTDKMLATIFRRKESTVKLALDTFQKFGMIEIIDGVVTIPNWGKHQKMDSIEKRNDYMREYMREYRERQKEIACKPNSKPNSKPNVSVPDIEEYKEEREYLIDSKESIRQTVDPVRQVIDEWNLLSEYGVARVNRVSVTSTRYKMANARICEYGLDEVIRTVRLIKDCDFLLGRVNNFVITFDWFVKPNNFPKVNEGKYLNRGVKVQRKEEPHEDDEYKDYR